jgi:hypothetical protein
LVVDAIGPHKGTLVWLHGVGDAPEHFKAIFDLMRFRGVRLVVPPAPTLPISAFNEQVMSAWFDLPRKPTVTDDPLLWEDDRMGILLV